MLARYFRLPLTLRGGLKAEARVHASTRLQARGNLTATCGTRPRESTLYNIPSKAPTIFIEFYRSSALMRISGSLPRDIQEFLERYPGGADDRSRSANLKFYSNESPCRPDNLLIDELHDQFVQSQCHIGRAKLNLYTDGGEIMKYWSTTMGSSNGCKSKPLHPCNEYRSTDLDTTGFPFKSMG